MSVDFGGSLDYDLLTEVQMTKELAESKFSSVELYEHQKRAIAALLACKSVLLMTPTGSGKSLCFQVYTKTAKKQILVVSPLISLMDDQEQKAKALGFSVGRLHSGVNPQLQWVTLARYLSGKIEILYASPEQVIRRQVQQILQNKPPGIVVIDEAHCISTWGRQFRPAYRRLGEFCKSLGGIPILAMTATAQPAIQADICQTLGLHNPEVNEVPFAFKNVALNVIHCLSLEERIERIVHLVRQPVHLPMIVFCLSRRRCEIVAKKLQEIGAETLIYHSGLPPAERSANAKIFSMSKHHTLIATSAFEMGIDKPDVRTVVHFDLPSSLESYVQGLGRCGRDGDDAMALLLYNDTDLDVIEHVNQYYAASANDMRSAVEVYQYALSRECRERVLNDVFFSTRLNQERRCGGCDNCQKRRFL